MNYEKIYDEYYFNGKKSVFYKFGYLEVDRYFNLMSEKVFKYVNKGRVLDVGCAYGFMLKRFQKAFSLYGIDVSDYAINIAKKNLPQAKFVIQNAEEKFPFKSSFFDLVLMHDVIEHIENPEKIIKNTRRVLKSGGFLYITTPNLNLLRVIFYGIFDRMEYHVSLLKHSDLIKLLKKKGFEIVEEWTFFSPFFPYIRITPHLGVQSAVICKK